MKRLVAFAACLALLGLGLPNLIVWLGGRGPATDDPARVPHAQAALVLGAQVKPDGLRVREAAARVKTLGDAVTGADPHFLGAQIPITGDGRASWGD